MADGQPVMAPEVGDPPSVDDHRHAQVGPPVDGGGDVGDSALSDSGGDHLMEFVGAPPTGREKSCTNEGSSCLAREIQQRFPLPAGEVAVPVDGVDDGEGSAEHALEFGFGVLIPPAHETRRSASAWR